MQVGDKVRYTRSPYYYGGTDPGEDYVGTILVSYGNGVCEVTHPSMPDDASYQMKLSELIPYKEAFLLEEIKDVKIYKNLLCYEQTKI